MDWIQSPTGTWEIRNDKDGLGSFLAPRGFRIHDGIDLTCLVGQDIYAPFKGRFLRTVDPYGDGDYSGMRIGNTWAIADILYIQPRLIQEDTVDRCQIIATAQDISARYSEEMKPHVHFRMFINPEMFYKARLLQWAKDLLKNTLGWQLNMA